MGTEFEKYMMIKYGIEPPKGPVVRYDHIKPNWLSIDKVVFNDPATIVFWKDGTKTVVKCSENEGFDPEKGLAMAIAKKAFGNQGNYYNQIKKWLPEEETGPVARLDCDNIFDALSKSIHKAKTAINSVCGLTAANIDNKVLDEARETESNETET